MALRKTPRAISGQRSSKATTSAAKQHTAADIYNDLVAEVTSESDFLSHDDERPLKRRKAGLRSAPLPPSQSIKGKEREVGRPVREGRDSGQFQAPSVHDTATEHSASEDDLAFEDVDLAASSSIYVSSDEDIEDVVVSVGADASKIGSTSTTRRKPGHIEKHLRVLGHKAHLIALLGHCMVINSRCNDARVHKILKPLLPQTTRAYLRPSKEHTQFQQDRTFTMGLQRAFDTFKEAFTISAPGMSRAYWHSDSSAHVGLEVVDRDDFIKAARKMTGSQDTGNQLFCAMLRAVGVRARLVCSLQVLPLANTAAVSSTPSKPVQKVFAIAPDRPLQQTSRTNVNLLERATAAARSRIDQPAFNAERPSPTPVRTKSTAYHKLAFPVFWVEVFNAAYQKWICIDPVVTQTLDKPSKLEPPLHYDLNQLVYAIGFSRNGAAKDVTRRYVKAYNAKTRRLRLESVNETEGLWLRKVMRMFKNRSSSNADTIEETELAQRIAREGLPGNIQDFKSHPIYALERHLKRHEVVHPRREAGKVNAGTAATPKMESIFRREDVHVCRSADQWFRHGRSVKAGEQALKLVPARMRRRGSDDESDNERSDSTALYILSQTELYIPKPVVRGKVPRNAFGNLDIYVPSMVPAGGTHIRHAQAKAAAGVLGVDAVDAVVGFKFSGRKGTTVVEGAIVPTQYAEALNAVIDGLTWQELDDRSRARSALAMKVWKRFLQGLKIAERVASYATEPIPQQDDMQEMTASTAWYADEEVPLHTAGRFTLDDLLAVRKTTKAKAEKKQRKVVIDDDGDTSMASVNDDDAGLVNNDDAAARSDILGGGFVVDSPPEHEARAAGDDLITNRCDTADETNPNAQGGGFLMDDDLDDDLNLPEHAADEEGGSLLNDDMNLLHHGADQEGGFVVDDNQQDSASSSCQPTSKFPLIDNTKREARGTAHQTSNTLLAGAKVPGESSAVGINCDAPRGASPIVKKNGAYTRGQRKSSRSDDEDSLLSHDPEDEDADPDWMESD